MRIANNMYKGVILYVGGFILPDVNAAAHRVMANAKVFHSLGYKVILVGVSKKTKERGIQKIEGFLDGIELYSLKYPNNIKEWIKYLFYTKHIKKFVESESVNFLIFYNYPSFSTIRLISYLKKKKVKYIADCTEWYDTGQGGMVRNAIKWMDTTLRMRWINKKVMHGVITISRFLEEYYSGCKTILIPPLVDKEDKKWINDLNDRDFLNNQTINLIYAGQPGSNKDNIKRLIIILSNIKKQNNTDFFLKIIGIPKEELVEWSKLNGLFLDAFTMFYGIIPHEKVIKEIRGSDFVVFLRDTNRTTMAGFPTKLVEAISAGTPILTNPSSNISDYIINYVNGFLLPTNEAEIESKLSSYVKLSKRDILTMKHACQNSSLFDYRNYIREFELFLNQFAEKR